jgi:hypothetical protein
MAASLKDFPACARCGAQDRPLSQCTKCRQVKYCSKDCQVLDWKHGHKQACLSPDDRSTTETTTTTHPAGTAPGSLDAPAPV